LNRKITVEKSEFLKFFFFKQERLLAFNNIGIILNDDYKFITKNSIKICNLVKPFNKNYYFINFNLLYLNNIFIQNSLILNLLMAHKKNFIKNFKI